jgi:hypothetical protein
MLIYSADAPCTSASTTVPQFGRQNGQSEPSSGLNIASLSPAFAAWRKWRTVPSAPHSFKNMTAR